MGARFGLAVHGPLFGSERPGRVAAVAPSRLARRLVGTASGSQIGSARDAPPVHVAQGMAGKAKAACAGRLENPDGLGIVARDGPAVREPGSVVLATQGVPEVAGLLPEADALHLILANTLAVDEVIAPGVAAF